MNAASDWWESNLDQYREEGRKDAELGRFDMPNATDEHGMAESPDYDDENQAYREGFVQRRKELGDKFEWK